ncbi:MAG: HNH endonuclease signature motif containing protein [Pseudonocardiaceae bacterium]
MRERTVIGYLGPEGTATITGSGLPADQAASACARIEELARAATRAGHPGRISPLRADIYLGLLDGRWQHHTGEQIITDLLTDATSDTEDGADPQPAAEPDAATGGEPPASDASGGGATADADDPAAHSVAEDGDSRETRPDGHPTMGEPGTALPVRRVGVEVRVGLVTLLDRDQHPGEIPGWGPIPAETARTMVAAQRAAEWRFAITDPTGQLLLAGITRRRPHHSAPDHTTLGHTASQHPPCRGGIVELQLPATLLTELATNPDTCGEWAGIVTDIATQYTQHTHRGPGKPHTQDPTTRFAEAALRRHAQIRDRFCVYPGCRATARSADLDHTRDHALGGPTTDTNSGPLCRHDHELKTAGWWRLHQPQPGHFTWISRQCPRSCT